jgi:hypothetical protein
MWQGLVQWFQSILSAVGNALSFAPPWAVSLVLLVGATAAAWSLHAAILAILHRLLRGRRPYLRSVLDETRNPTRFGLLLIALAIALPTAPLGPDTESVIAQRKRRSDRGSYSGGFGFGRYYGQCQRRSARKVDRFPAAGASRGAAAAPLRSRREYRAAIGRSARAPHLTRALIAQSRLRDQGCCDPSSAATIAAHSAANSPVAGARPAC